MQSTTFREKVWYKQIREQQERKENIESEWHEGLCPGQSRSTNETIVETAEDAALEGTSNETHEDHREHAPEVRVHGGLRGLLGQSCGHDSEAPWRSLSETNRASIWSRTPSQEHGA